MILGRDESVNTQSNIKHRECYSAIRISDGVGVGVGMYGTGRTWPFYTGICVWGVAGWSFH
jgi:hypothetical protein